MIKILLLAKVLTFNKFTFYLRDAQNLALEPVHTTSYLNIY